MSWRTCCNIILSNFGERMQILAQCPVLSWQEWHLVMSSAAVAYLLQSSMSCVSRDGLLHTDGSAYRRYAEDHITVALYHPEPVWPFFSDIWHQQDILDIFPFSCVKIPVDQQFLKYSEQPVWHQQPLFHLDALFELHQVILTMPKCIDCCHVIGW